MHECLWLKGTTSAKMRKPSLVARLSRNLFLGIKIKKKLFIRMIFSLFFVVFLVLANFMVNLYILTIYSKSIISFNFHVKRKTKAVLERGIQCFEMSVTKFFIFNLKISFFQFIWFSFFTLIFQLCVFFTLKWD